MNQKIITKIVLTFLAVVLVGALGYIFLIKKSTATQPTDIANSSLPTTCVDEPEATPVITSITPTSGPVDSKVTIRGCNFVGFEGDLKAVFVREDGKEIPLYGGTWFPGYGGDTAKGKVMFFYTKSYCPTGSEIGQYSGAPTPCQTVEANPGVYKVYVTAWGKKSNEATYTIK